MRLIQLIVSGAAVAAAATCDAPKPKSDPQVASGVQFKVLKNGLSRPRGVIMDSKGNLLVVEAGGNGITRMILDGDGMDTCVTNSSQLVDDKNLNHGIAFSADGKTLFASSANDVFAYSYDAEKGTAGKAKNIITGMDQSDHQTRTLLVPRQNSDMLLVSRGSNDNIDKDTVNEDSGRSQIRIFTIADLMDSDSAVQYTDGKILGWGLRNSVGVADHPTTGEIWSVENSIDNMKREDEDVHNSNPGEELNFHGRPNDTSSDVYGKNFGYPACVAIFDTSNVKDYPGGAKTGMQMVGDQMTNNYTDKWCQDDTVAPYITFGSHLAPLDIKFSKDGNQAFIAFHGSWNRKPPNGYRLSRVQFNDKGVPVADKNSTSAEEELMWNADNSQCPSQCFRPAGLELDADGKRTFMSSDASGELFLVTGTETNQTKTANPSQPTHESIGSSTRVSMFKWLSMKFLGH